MSSEKHGDDEENKNKNDDLGSSEEENKTPDDPTPLLKSAKETLDDLRRVSKLDEPIDIVDESLEDDEADLKLPPPAAQIKDQTSTKKQSSQASYVPKIIKKDIEKAYKEAKLEQKNKDSLHINVIKKPRMLYDEEQASLMGAVLGIGERNKDADEQASPSAAIVPKKEQTPQTSAHSIIGTLAGLGDITDEDADLREISESSVINDEDLQQDLGQSMSSAGKEEVSIKTENVDKDEEASHAGEKSASKKSGGMLSKIRKMSQKLFR